MHIHIENSLNLWAESFGNQRKEAILLISGAGAGCSFWSERLCNSLAHKGYYAIRYDHRDFGYSTKVDFDSNPYNMMDLTRDAIAILDSLELEKAHVVGHSMGGFIAQLMAIHFPERVLSITSASSSTNSPTVPPPPEKTWEIFMKNKPSNDFEKDLEGFMHVWKYLNGTLEFNEEMAIDYTRSLYERQNIDGPLGASHVRAQENLVDRSEQLKRINIPAMAIHGIEDYLVDQFGGIQTAECIHNAQLKLIPGMGHMLFNKEVLQNFEQTIIKFITS